MTTNQRTACLNAESMEWLAQGEFPAAELAQLEEHIGSCEHCRCMLESASIDSQWNDEVLPVLRTPSDGNGMFGDPKDVAQDEQSLESVLKLLGPTDDPHKLGRIGSYEVIGVIGRGGMGVVFKAFDAALNRFVAIKMLLPHLAISGAARKRFAREGQAAAAVIDDNVLPIYSVAEWQGVPYLVTQYSRGMTLQKRIQNQGPLELKEILRIGMQTARGLAAAHAQGLVHRDVKPSNILLDGTVERALLTDFGLARAVDDASITRTGIIAGTPQYMSPEQARGGSVDARSDLFGLGCVLYTMCTGRPPFRADNSYAVLRLITDAEPRPIREINPEIPEWLCRVIARLMAKLPNERFASATEVADLLESCLAHVQQPTVTSLPEQLLITQSVNERKNIGRWMAVIGAVLIGLLGVFGFVISIQSQNGTLLIESTVDDVTVRVSQGDTVVRKLTVTKAGTKIDVAAGSYTVAIEGNVDGIAIENDKVNLRQGGTEIVTLTYQRPDETRTSQVGSTTADPASSEQQLKLLEQAIFVTDVRSNGQVLYFTLNQWKFPEGALGLLEIQFRCEKPMPLVWTGPAPDAATVLSPKHTVEWLGMAALPVIPLPIGPAGHKVAFIFPDDDSAVVAAKQLAAIGDQSLLDAQRRSNSIDGRLRDDGIIFGEHAAIGRYTTEFRLLYRMDPAPSVNLQLPRIEAATWQRMYVSALTNPIFAKRYQLTEAQQQQVLKLQTELNQRPTPINRHELMIETQTAIQKVLTLEQDQQVWRDIFVAWNINKFRDANILDQLQATDAQRSQIDAIWQAMSQKTENAPVGEVDTAAERQRVFDEILGLLTREQQQKWQQELLETPFDSQQPHPVEMMPAPFDGAISNAIGNYRTHFPVPVRNEVTPEQPGHGIQRPQFVGVNWRPLYLAVVTHPTAATRYSLTEPQQQEIKTLFDEFVRTSTVETHDDLLKLTQTTVQEVLTPVQDENVRREIWIRWNVTKFRDPKILFQLNITDEQQQQIDAIWQASQERIGPFQDPPAIPGLSTAFTPARLAVEGPTESQRVFDEIYAILTIRQRGKLLSEIQDPIVDGLLPDTRQRVLAIPKGAVREIAAPPQAQMALAFPTINWRQVYMGKAMETRFARRQHLTAKQQQRMHDIIQVFLRNATPTTRNMGERRAQSAIQNLLTIDQDRLLRREIWVAMNATRLRVPTTHEQLGLNSEQRRQIDGIWSKFETEVQQNGGQRADGSDSYERIFDEIFDVLTSEQRRLYLFKFQDPVFHSGTQPIPFGVDWNPDDFPAQEKDPPRLVDVLDLHLRRERERFPLLEQVVDDIHLLEGGGLEILERPVLADREQYAKDHPELAKAFEAWQNDYRDVLRVSEIIPELFQEDTRPVMVTVARLLIQSEDIPGISKEQLAHANQELGEYPTDKLVERVFLELGEAGHGNLRRKLRESGANLPHTGTHENHLRIAEKEKTYLILVVGLFN